MRFIIWIPAEMVDAHELTVTLVPTDAVNPLSLGAQVICTAPISQGGLQNAVSIDGQDSLVRSESNDSCGMQSKGTCVVDDACQFLSALEDRVVHMLVFPVPLAVPIAV